MMLDIMAGTISAALVPATLRSRVSGAFIVVNYGVRPLGTSIGGFLGATIGLRPTLWIATVGALAGLLWIIPSPIMSLHDVPGGGPGMTDDPLQLFHEWVDGDEMAIATATPDGRPSLRALLLKSADARGFTFFTNYESRKGRRAGGEPVRARCSSGARASRCGSKGRVHRLDEAESDAYWATRPPGSRRSAAASRQSQPIGSREELEALVAAQPENPPRPARWGGFRLEPETYEFWRHRDDRLHERHLFRRSAAGWQVLLLQP